MLANEKHKATFMAPIGVGLALFVAEMVGVYYTGGSLNPARSFGPCVISGVWDQEHWIYCKSRVPPLSYFFCAMLRCSEGVGPSAGAILAWAFYKFIKVRLPLDDIFLLLLTCVPLLRRSSNTKWPIRVKNRAVKRKPPPKQPMSRPRRLKSRARRILYER